MCILFINNLKINIISNTKGALIVANKYSNNINLPYINLT